MSQRKLIRISLILGFTLILLSSLGLGYIYKSTFDGARYNGISISRDSRISISAITYQVLPPYVHVAVHYVSSRKGEHKVGIIYQHDGNIEIDSFATDTMNYDAQVQKLDDKTYAISKKMLGPEADVIRFRTKGAVTSEEFYQYSFVTQYNMYQNPRILFKVSSKYDLIAAYPDGSKTVAYNTGNLKEYWIDYPKDHQLWKIGQTPSIEILLLNRQLKGWMNALQIILSTLVGLGIGLVLESILSRGIINATKDTIKDELNEDKPSTNQD